MRDITVENIFVSESEDEMQKKICAILAEIFSKEGVKAEKNGDLLQAVGGGQI